MTTINKETGEITNLDDLDDEQFIGVLAAAEQETKESADQYGHLVMYGIQRAAARGATVLYGKGQNFVVKQDNETDWAKMPPVLEFLTPEEKKEAYKPEHTITVLAVPEHDEVVLGKWAPKGTVMKLLRRHGDQAVAKADEATFPGRAIGKLVQTDASD